MLGAIMLWRGGISGLLFVFLWVTRATPQTLAAAGIPRHSFPLAAVGGGRRAKPALRTAAAGRFLARCGGGWTFCVGECCWLWLHAP